jgi:hypothetical protein
VASKSGPRPVDVLRKANDNKRTIGIKSALERVEHKCHTCQKAKMTSLKPQFHTHKDNMKPGEYLHADIITMPCQTQSGYKYILLFIDDVTNYAWIFLLRRKNDLDQHMKKLCARIFKQYNIHVRKLRTDNEFMTNWSHALHTRKITIPKQSDTTELLKIK